MDDSLTYTIIIPVKPAGAVRALERLRKSVDYPAERFEVLVAEGRQPSRQRNLAAAEAKGEVLYFLDDDSLTGPGFLRSAARHFADPAVAVVGGPSLTPETDTLFQRAVGIALASPLGGGGARNRYRRVSPARATSERELILCNLAFRKEIFLALGGLDERLYPNEENELLDRIAKGGLGLRHDPDLAVERSQRPTLRAFFRQFFGYGRGRGEQTRIAGVRSVVDFLPSLFFAYLLMLPLLPWWPALLPLGVYGLAVIVSALAGVSGKRLLPAIPWLMILYPALHLCYGFGFARGLAAPRFVRNSGGGAGISIRLVKSLGAPWTDHSQEAR
ncbi:glycosyltransferase family 2 protein [Geobacter sp.]|uniref:glycosyltransferase family 2 protein n=1 Tax=Geobacter sp. TaxID=46610 RepID=UPI0027B8ABAB|nr:glycosyltransferase family 2 protein [Geobacter sp.]